MLRLVLETSSTNPAELFSTGFVPQLFVIGSPSLRRNHYPRSLLQYSPSDVAVAKIRQ